MTDIEIASSCKKDNIIDIAKKIGLDEDLIECYGKYKAKINFFDVNTDKNGKLILVTSINPTPYGEGKTTVSIGLNDGLNCIGKNSIAVLREPSLGPVFGIKGGATGGRYAQIVPMEDINLHFTGDLHAITTANNLISAAIDNHIFFGNELNIDPNKITFQRCMDMNDRALRNITIKGGNKIERQEKFNITAASEIMSVLCLSNYLAELKEKLGNILIGFTTDNKPVYTKDLKLEGALTVILKDALKPNLVQSLENNPVIVHGGPFANIAHGCNSIAATKMAMKLGYYVITEAGFGADLGAEKFFDIKCRTAGIVPSAVVCVATIKALKYHGGQKISDIENENLQCLENGIENLLKHIDNIKNVYDRPVVVAINRFTQDTDNEIQLLKDKLKSVGIEMSLTEVWAKGGEGALDLAEKVIKISDNAKTMEYAYNLKDSIENKIRAVAQKIYGARDIVISDEAKAEIERIEKLGYGHYPVCIAKTQYSFSDDPKNLECKEPFDINVREIILKNGAEFIVAITGNIFTMPGLPETPAAEKIGLDEFENIVGLF